ncbi:MAG: plastocyanin/azurin family copper-binding protein [Gemmatimonadaceae bacterium]
MNRGLVVAISLGFQLGAVRDASAQSLLDRPPNVSGAWVGVAGSLYFHFIHRFSTSGAPERKVTNVPTFLIAAGLPAHLLAGFNYSTNSTLAPRFPNEWEAFARWAPLSQDLGAPVDVGGQVGYNNAARGVDGEVSVAHRFGQARLIVAGRALSDPLVSGHQRYAIAGGGTLRLGSYAALAGDVSSLADRDSTERIAWSAALHVAIPLTPHTVSLQVTNTLVESLQGASRGTNRLRYGFEFTIPLTLSRYFGRREAQVSDSDSPPAQPEVPATAADTPPSLPAPASVSPPVSADTTRAKLNTNSTVKVPTTNVLSAVPTRPVASKPATSPQTSTPVRAVSKTVRNGMKNINYQQGRLQIKAGTTVEWTNADPLPHSVTAVDKSFNSGLIQPGKTFRHTFTRAGTFSYFCMPHPFMKGVIVVKE